MSGYSLHCGSYFPTSCPVIFDWMAGIVSSSLLGSERFCACINLVERVSGMHLGFWGRVWSSQISPLWFAGPAWSRYQSGGSYLPFPSQDLPELSMKREFSILAGGKGSVPYPVSVLGTASLAFLNFKSYEYGCYKKIKFKKEDKNRCLLTMSCNLPACLLRPLALLGLWAFGVRRACFCTSSGWSPSLQPPAVSTVHVGELPCLFVVLGDPLQGILLILATSPVRGHTCGGGLMGTGHVQGHRATVSSPPCSLPVLVSEGPTSPRGRSFRPGIDALAALPHPGLV